MLLIRLIAPAFVYACVFCCLPLYAIDAVPLQDTYQQYQDQGDYYFQKSDYYLAFQAYQNAQRLNNASPAIHYRLGKIYGMLQSQTEDCEREWALAFTLYLRKFLGIAHTNSQNFRYHLGIPIDSLQTHDELRLNPVIFQKRDIDHDGQDEVFVILQRGVRSYVVFVLDFRDQTPRVQHLLTFQEGQTGRSVFKFQDIDGDEVEEVLFVVHSGDYLSVFIHRKDALHGFYDVLSQPLLLHGSWELLQLAGDQVPEVLIEEDLPESTIFSEKTGPWLKKRSIWQWDSYAYALADEEVVHNAAYGLNHFFKALILDNDLKEAYRWIDPSAFFEDYSREHQFPEFKRWLQQEPYRIFLASEGAHLKVLHQLELHRKPISNTQLGWDNSALTDLGEIHQDPEHVTYCLNLGQRRYELELQLKGEWRVVRWEYIEPLKTGWQTSS